MQIIPGRRFGDGKVGLRLQTEYDRRSVVCCKWYCGSGSDWVIGKHDERPGRTRNLLPGRPSPRRPRAKLAAPPGFRSGRSGPLEASEAEGHASLSFYILTVRNLGAGPIGEIGSAFLLQLL